MKSSRWNTGEGTGISASRRAGKHGRTACFGRQESSRRPRSETAVPWSVSPNHRVIRPADYEYWQDGCYFCQFSSIRPNATIRLSAAFRFARAIFRRCNATPSTCAGVGRAARAQYARVMHFSRSTIVACFPSLNRALKGHHRGSGSCRSIRAAHIPGGNTCHQMASQAKLRDQDRVRPGP